MKLNALIHRNPVRGFTLVEVVLAISIATGLLVVALHLYHQSAELRTQLLRESERLTAVRLLIDRMTSDLRTAFAQPQEGFIGYSTSLRFVKTSALSRQTWIAASTERKPTLETDLKLVSYGVNRALEGTNLTITGIFRTESPLIEMRTVLPATTFTNEPASSPTNQYIEPLTDTLRFVRFRYWDGTGWVESWTGSTLPQGVEVSLGADPLPEEEVPEDYASEIFRRVIYLPEGTPKVGEQTVPLQVSSTGTALDNSVDRGQTRGRIDE